jgi:hypothetical protein
VRSAASRHSLHRRFVVLSTLLLLGVLVVGCGTGISGTGMKGSWSSENGTLDFSASTSPFPYAYDSRAGVAGGDGSRSTASKTSMHDGALLVDVPGGQLQLTRESADRLLILEAENGIPAPGSGVYLRSGTPASNPSEGASSSPEAP